MKISELVKKLNQFNRVVLACEHETIDGYKPFFKEWGDKIDDVIYMLEMVSDGEIDQKSIVDVYKSVGEAFAIKIDCKYLFLPQKLMLILCDKLDEMNDFIESYYSHGY